VRFVAGIKAWAAMDLLVHFTNDNPAPLSWASTEWTACGVVPLQVDPYPFTINMLLDKAGYAEVMPNEFGDRSPAHLGTC
jgi:hypothetical protein